ncbi:MAG: GAF domain-containing protein [Alkalinema sp. RL_2_19]|nr:GAF domain-containing protein [Alkalinema sp. RL_2_19]
MPWSLSQLLRGEIVTIQDIQQLPLEAQPDQQSYAQLAWRSLIAIPLLATQQVVGWLGFAACNAPLAWSTEQLRLLEIFAAILTHGLQRNETEQALQRSQQQYQSLVDRITAGVYVLQSHDGLTFEFASVSTRWCVINQIPAETVLADAVVAFQRLHPDDQGDLMWAYRESYRTMQPLFWEGRMVVDGRIIGCGLKPFRIQPQRE